MRKLSVLLLLIGLALIGWVGFDYSTSGREVARFELSGEEGSTDIFQLDPSQNPLRALLSVKYEIELLGQNTPAFQYSVLMTGPGGLEAFKAEGQQRDKREDNTPEYVTKTSEEIIETFSVAAPGDYLLDWRIVPEKAKIISQSITLRENVTPLRVPYLIAGGVSFILGVLLLIRRRKRSS